MNALTSHNAAMRTLLLSKDKEQLKNLVDLDNIDLVLRELLTIEEMREAGSFFTGQKLATKAVGLLSAITSSSVVLDPACGAGNLLIEASRKLGVESTLSATLKLWGNVLWGFDIHPHFIEATKLRIVIEALNQGVEQDCDLDEAFKLLPNIQIRDAFTVGSEDLSNVTHFLMNPPFTIMPAPKQDYWKKGKVNTAGVMFDKYLRDLPKGCKVSAILPDVLRSGSRYSDFREFVSESMQTEIGIWGRFNNKTDVDVFLLSGVIGTTDQVAIWHSAEDVESTISDYFEVRTGPLVAYRDPEEGTLYPYFYPKICPQWEVVRETTERRRFSGKALNPPFVVIKRTSSPSDKYRASATLINLREPVAIENHMLVVTPRDGRVDTCRRLMRVLQNQQTNDFLNKRIRLRHLTVGVVKDIPFSEA
ncbi:SAM-dependent DNA methyltransferase [Vibrio parahaemolyticus]|uniref:N-6 DNA methylase n=1 Tax=Vibrio parahaemolyticus TaxID=670 RepID=UPI000992BF06|nr:N-6 DNA methylase [Vibrio parahaemolyticus]OOQ68180.1 SAM-dependent methyltransferase [Vibrio parahaemolyticus]PMT76246.1 SAM-dependent DNA methyltransferase [Vibrio parahaemolyticus]PMT81782.1 SAM-dependent DNA methyltransferase [Vibrio parahaemolyticus]